MTTARQQATNRANARRSTGPKTVHGKLASSKNAQTHGLTSRHADDQATAAVERLAHAFAAGKQGEMAWHQALVAAEATFEVAHVRSIRADMLAQIGWGDGPAPPVISGQAPGIPEDPFRRVARLERYERRALSRRKSAIRELELMS